MDSDEVVRRLSTLSLFESVPQAELEWLAARGEVRTYGADAIVHQAGSAIDEMSILLAGRAALSVPKGGAARRILRAGAGYVLGVIPYSRYRNAPGDVIVEEETTALALHRRNFPDLILNCPELTAALVHQMIDRTRDYRTAQLHDERMQSLGRLASGLAHELNNPASAAARGAESLVTLLDEAERAGKALAAARLTDAQLEVIETLRVACGTPVPAPTALEAADREDDITEWLTRHAVAPEMAGTLAASEVSVAALDRLADAVPPAVLGTAIAWVSSVSAARAVARQIASATRRMHDLVRSVKGFTFMDREGVTEEIDVARGLADTIAMLESKSRGKSVAVRLETAADLPRVYGVGSEINQVWEKLIDNAIDAVDPEGNVVVTATSRGGAVVVKVADDGRGIPAEHRERIFDPFFTTKPVGQGTGLGLDLARRLVHLHHGDIECVSQPGRTVFRVRLPAAGGQALH